MVFMNYWGARVGDDFGTKKLKITNLKYQMVIQ